MSAKGADYSKVRSGRLKLKGVKRSALHSASQSKPKKEKRKELEDIDVKQADLNEHGGWWPISEPSELKSATVALEGSAHCYISAMDNGKFTLGPPHDLSDGPFPEEQFNLVRPADSQWFSLKTGYGKYISVDGNGQLIAMGETIGLRERWELVFEEGETAIQASNSSFLCWNPDQEGYIYASSKTAKEHEKIKVRSNREPDRPIDFTPEIDRKGVGEVEVSYVKHFQSFQDRRVLVNQDDKGAVKQAKLEGTLHETLLNRRQKMKADRYCK